MKLGINLHRSGFGSDGAFLDLMKHSISGNPDLHYAPWVSANQNMVQDNPQRPISVDRYGWVQSLLANQIAVTNIPIVIGGLHYVLFDGEGTLKFGNGSVAGITGVIAGKKYITITFPQPVVDQSINIQMAITATNPINPLRNIQIIPASYISTIDTLNLELPVFHTTFLNALMPFDTIRLMEWGRIDENIQPIVWADRTTTLHASQAGSLKGGVCYEYQIQLANILNKNLWINIPHTVGDDFVTNLAILLRDNLKSNLKAYIAWSNEVWNGGYPQHAYAQQQGIALGLDTNPNIAGLKYQSQRSVAVWSIFDTVYGTERSNRIVRVMENFVGQINQHNVLLTWKNALSSTDVLAVASYFGYPNVDAVTSSGQTIAQQIEANTLDWLMNDLLTKEVPATIALVQTSFNYAQSVGLPLVCYEGGQSLVATAAHSPTADINNKFNTANDDPRMGDCHKLLWDSLKAMGLPLSNHYAMFYRPSVFGRWGLLKTRESALTSPKYTSATTWISVNP